LKGTLRNAIPNAIATAEQVHCTQRACVCLRSCGTRDVDRFCALRVFSGVRPAGIWRRARCPCAGARIAKPCMPSDTLIDALVINRATIEKTGDMRFHAWYQQMEKRSSIQSLYPSPMYASINRRLRVPRCTRALASCVRWGARAGTHLSMRAGAFGRAMLRVTPLLLPSMQQAMRPRADALCMVRQRRSVSVQGPHRRYRRYCGRRFRQALGTHDRTYEMTRISEMKDR